MTQTIASPGAATALPASGSGVRPFIGSALVRFVIPSWVFAGALFKLVSFNPQLLPPPVQAVIQWVGDATGQPYIDALLFWMRAIIAVELLAVGFMYFVPRLARVVAISILSLFCLILVLEVLKVVNGAMFAKNGISELFKPCGCFGAKSPPAFVMFLIDGAMLAGACFCRPGPRGRTLPRWPISGVAAVATIVVACGMAFGRPDRPAPQPTPDNAAVTTDGASGDAAAQTSKPKDDPSAHAAPATVAPWPPAPAKLDRTYVLLVKKAVGQRFDSLPVALQINRPMPEKFNAGRWNVVFYRKDCDHCFEVMNKHFAGELAAPTLAVEVTEPLKGKPQPMPCKKCEQHFLPKGPDYMVETPMILTIEDGVIVAATKDVDKPGAVEAVLKAKPGDPPVDGAIIMPKPAAASPSGAGATTPATKLFPPPPKTLEAYYAVELDKLEGKRFDEQPIALIMPRPLPVDLNKGDVLVIYYRATCDHCHNFLMSYFASGVPCPTVAVEVPEETTEERLDMPCSDCKLSVLPTGPIYVLGTPSMLVLKDGVIRAVIDEKAAEVPDAVKAVLPNKQ